MKRSKSKSSQIINPSSQNPKESRLYVKQQEIKRKLSKVQSHEQLQKIYSMMKSQNQQLSKDLAILKLHLSQVEENKKLQTSNLRFRNDSIASSRMTNHSTMSSALVNQILQLQKCQPQFVKEWEKLKKQLQEQYKLMNCLKGNITSLQKEVPTSEVNEQKMNRKNKIKQIQTEIQSETNKRKLLVKENQNLQQTFDHQFNHTNLNTVSLDEFQRENQQLKKKILAFKQETYKHETKAAQVIDSIYKKKEVLTQYESITKNSSFLDRKLLNSQPQNALDSLRKRSNSINSNTIDPQKTLNKKSKNIVAISSISNHYTKQSPNQISPSNQSNQTSSFLNSQITELKQQVNKMSLAEIKTKQEAKKKKQSLKESITKLNEQFKDLQRVKTKKVSELNHLKSKIKNIIREIQLKQTLKVKMVNFGVQKDEFKPTFMKEPLRRDFAGVIGNRLLSDDRIFLKQQKRTLIKGLIVYENLSNLAAKGSLVAIRAIYSDQQTNLLNQVPIPGQYLQKCKSLRYDLPQDDFLKLIKVKYNTKQTRVTKIQVRSNRNLKYEFGEKKPFHETTQYDTVYAFDIGLDELPVSIFSSYCHLRGCWYLEGIGAEINTLQ